MTDHTYSIRVSSEEEHSECINFRKNVVKDIYQTTLKRPFKGATLSLNEVIGSQNILFCLLDMLEVS